MITVHSKSIGIHLHMPMIADGIGVPLENLRLVQNHAGGTFGYKFSPTNEALIGAAVKILERPVSLVFNQFQNITYTGKRSPAFMNIKLAADENGKLLALWGNNYVDHGPYSEFGDLLTMRLSQFTGAGYGINSIRNKSTTVFTNMHGVQLSVHTVLLSLTWDLRLQSTFWQPKWESILSICVR